MPRRNRDRDRAAARADPRVPVSDAVGWARTESWSDGQWIVRTVPGSRGLKWYRCPGCDQEIRPGTSHVVAWPQDLEGVGGADERRHWHSACWTARDRRRPGHRKH